MTCGLPAVLYTHAGLLTDLNTAVRLTDKHGPINIVLLYAQTSLAGCRLFKDVSRLTYPSPHLICALYVLHTSLNTCGTECTEHRLCPCVTVCTGASPSFSHGIQGHNLTDQRDSMLVISDLMITHRHSYCCTRRHRCTIGFEPKGRLMAVDMQDPILSHPLPATQPVVSHQPCSCLRRPAQKIGTPLQWPWNGGSATGSYLASTRRSKGRHRWLAR